MFGLKDKVKFVAYTDNLSEEDKIYSKGDILLINSIEEDDKYEVICIDGDRKGKSSYVYSDEIESLITEAEKFEEAKEETFEEESSKEVKKETAQKELIKRDKLLELSPEEVINNALNSAEKSKKNEFSLAKYASIIREYDLHESYGDVYRGTNGFKKFCEDVLDYDYQKTLRLISIHKNCEEAGVLESELEGITYTKAYHISRIITEENKEELLEYARNHSVREVKAYVASKNIFTDDEELEAAVSEAKTSCSLTFKFTEDQYKHVIDGLDGIKNHIPDAGDNLNLVFMYVLNEFLNHYNVEIPEKQTLEHFNLKMGTNLTMQDINSARERLEEI